MLVLCTDCDHCLLVDQYIDIFVEIVFCGLIVLIVFDLPFVEDIVEVLFFIIRGADIVFDYSILLGGNFWRKDLESKVKVGEGFYSKSEQMEPITFLLKIRSKERVSG